MYWKDSDTILFVSVAGPYSNFCIAGLCGGRPHSSGITFEVSDELLDSSVRFERSIKLLQESVERLKDLLSTMFLDHMFENNGAMDIFAETKTPRVFKTVIQY